MPRTGLSATAGAMRNPRRKLSVLSAPTPCLPVPLPPHSSHTSLPLLLLLPVPPVVQLVDGDSSSALHLQVWGVKLPLTLTQGPTIPAQHRPSPCKCWGFPQPPADGTRGLLRIFLQPDGVTEPPELGTPPAPWNVPLRQGSAAAPESQLLERPSIPEGSWRDDVPSGEQGSASPLHPRHSHF